MGSIPQRHPDALCHPARRNAIPGAAHGARNGATKLSLLRLLRALHQLDAGAPWIGDVGDDDAGRFVLARGLIELDAFRLDLLDERSVVLDVEADVVEHTTAG